MSITIKFLVWENTTRKELHPLDLTSKVGLLQLQNLPITAPLGNCMKNVIAELTL